MKRVAFDAARRPAALLERWRRPVVPSVELAFVVGCAHSGTTVLRNRLGELPGVHAVGVETRLFEFPRYRWEVTREIRAWERAAQRAGCDMVVEKTPNHVVHLRRILAWVPDARIIGVIRDPRDVAASLSERNRSLETAIAKWVAAAMVLDVVASVPWGIVVRYEDLVAEPRAVLDRLAGFLGRRLDPGGDGMVTAAVDRAAIGEGPEPGFRYDHRSHHRYRDWQASQPLFDGRGRWVGVLDPAQLELLLAATGSLASRWGYQW